MSEKQTPDEQDSIRSASKASQRLLENKETELLEAGPVKPSRLRITPAGKATAVVAAVAALAGTQAAVNAANENDRREQIIQEYEMEQEQRDLLRTMATEPADPLDIRGAFTIEDELKRLVDYANEIAASQDDYEENKNFINYTILETSKDQGIYHEGDQFAVTEVEFDGKDTYIVQPMPDGENYDELPAVKTR